MLKTRTFSDAGMARIMQPHAVRNYPWYFQGEKPNPRLCTLTKVDGAFGFFLRDGAGHYLNQIEKGGSADLAGVIENDKILEINGVNVESESHGQVRKKMQFH